MKFPSQMLLALLALAPAAVTAAPKAPGTPSVNGPVKGAGKVKVHLDDAHKDPTLAKPPISQKAATPAKIHVEVTWVHEMVNVGNLDTFNVIWQKIHAVNGNLLSILTHDKYTTFSNGCNHNETMPDTTVDVRIDGKFGELDGLEPIDAREALVKALSNVLKILEVENQYDVYTGCYGTTPTEGRAYLTGAACGGTNPTHALDCQCKYGKSRIATAECKAWSVGKIIPDSIKAELFRVEEHDNHQHVKPEVPYLKIDFSMAPIIPDKGCGPFIDLAVGIVDFLPAPFNLFAKGIQTHCD